MAVNMNMGFICNLTQCSLVNTHDLEEAAYPSSSSKIEIKGSSETISSCQTTRRHIPED